MARDFSKSFYNSKEWAKVRQAVLMRDKYLCTKCGRPAEEVHHKTHLTPTNIMDVSVSLNMDNLTSLCKDCHFEEHRGEHGSGRKKQDELPQYEFDESGQIIPVQK